MSESNKALCRRFIEEVWNNRNLNLIEEMFAANFTEHDPASPDFGRGPECVRKTVNYYMAAFPDTRFTIEDAIGEGDRVAMRWTVRGTHRGALAGVAPTGKQITVTGTSIYRVQNNKIVEAFENWDALGLMQQIGVVSRQTGRASA